MSLIVDAQVAQEILVNRNDPDFLPVSDGLWNARTKVKMVIGGSKLKAEMFQSNQRRSKILELFRSGKALLVDDATVDAQQQVVHSMGIRSDDPHILALARVSGVRLLCSLDLLLTQDFKDLAIVPAPKGQVYSRRSHAHLLRSHSR